MINPDFVADAEKVGYLADRDMIVVCVTIKGKKILAMLPGTFVPLEFRPRSADLPAGTISAAVREQVEGALEFYVESGDDVWALAEEALKALRGQR